MMDQRIIKMGRTQSEIQQVEGRAVRNIRGRAAQIQEIMRELAEFESCMSSPNDSPIKVNNKSSSGQNISQIQQFLNKKQPVRQQIEQSTPQFKKTRPSSKHQTCSVHFTHYMKPIGKLSDKCKNILERQRKAKEQEQAKQLTLLRQSKQKSTKLYKNVPPRYNTANDTKILKEDAILQYQLQKEQKQLAGVTFSPTINKNIRVEQPFEMRMQISKIKKLQKEGAILKSAMKEQTYQPKINTKHMTQSKVKKLWSSNSPNTSELIATTSRSLQCLQPHMRSRVKVTKASDLNFIIQQI